jgi:DNA topoisomerase-1
MKNQNLVIVESPTKAKTISKILGDTFKVVSSMGHLIDLPQKELGVDVEKDFLPSYVVIPGRKKILAELKKEGKDKKNIYMATDPDREGEAIGWQLKDRLFKNKNVRRVIFHEITSKAVNDAFAHPRDFDLNMVEAQGRPAHTGQNSGLFLKSVALEKNCPGLKRRKGTVCSLALDCR